MVDRDAETALMPRTHFTEFAPARVPVLQTQPACDVVYVVHDDPQIREDIAAFLAALDVKVIAFAAATGYLDFLAPDTAACVVLSLRLPDLSGLELQQRLAHKGNPPVIFVADHSDVASTVCAMKAGAIEFLTQPIDLAALLEAIRAAFVQDRRARQQKAELATLRERLGTLTSREREVLPLIAGGLLNKQAASILGISEVTLQVHRSQLMRKMKATSFADLVRMAVKLGIPIVP
jgi:FixJ family two-component response regulator